MRNSRVALSTMFAAAAALSALPIPVSGNAGYVPPKRKPYVHRQNLKQGQEVQAWNAAVQAKRDAKLARKGQK